MSVEANELAPIPKTRKRGRHATDATAVEMIIVPPVVPLYSVPDVTVYHADWRALIACVDSCDLLIVDAPYSEKTHSGHAGGSKTANRASAWAEATNASPEQRYAAKGKDRRELNYSHWSASDVDEFVAAWAPKTRGWFVTITDNVLAPYWAESLAKQERYVFAPLPYVDQGSRCRMAGDGPSNWTCWIVVARPRNDEFSSWGTLPGAYIVPRGWAERRNPDSVVGGKCEWVMGRLIEHYSKPNDLVVDPCAGAGTTAKAALETGRRCITGDVLREHAEMTVTRVARPTQRPLFVAGEL